MSYISITLPTLREDMSSALVELGSVQRESLDLTSPTVRSDPEGRPRIPSPQSKIGPQLHRARGPSALFSPAHEGDTGAETCQGKGQMVREDEGSGSKEAVQPRIVVGVDGSPPSLSALEWAAREACLRGATLEVVHATFLRHDAMELDSLAWLKARESAILDKAVAKASALAPGLVVLGRAGDPPAAELLVDVSKDADLLVVGSRGLGLFKELALGSVSQDCARHAQCPLVIIGPRMVHTATVGNDAAQPPVGARRP